jgi:hypothetical protein
MSTVLGRNVEAYEPETDPANIEIDYDSLRSRGWPSSVLDCIQALQKPGSLDLMHHLDFGTAKPYLSESE